jgi:hypothetical protein
MFWDRAAGDRQSLLHLGQLLAGLLQLNAKTNQAHPRRAGSSQGLGGRSGLGGSSSRRLRRAGGASVAGRARGKQVEGGAEFIQPQAQLWTLAQQLSQLLAFVVVEVTEGVAGQQGIDRSGGRRGGERIREAHGSLR